MSDPLHRIPVEAMVKVVSAAIAGDWLTESSPAVIFHDLDRLDARLDAILDAFPAGALHAIAIKANPLVALLRHVADRGFGLEAASFEEVELALAAGCPPDRIVYDSPCKTRDELRRALLLGLHVNVDNLDELARVADHRANVGGRGTVGLRINPRVGAGDIPDTSLADDHSKFGLPLPDDPTELVDTFLRHPWLTGIHVHVGSQGCSTELLVAGVRRAVDLAREVDRAAGRRQVTVLDIGGGLPVAYGEDERAPTFASYAAALRRALPELFDGTYRVVTEFGRSVHAGCGFAVSMVEYVKRIADGPMAVIHLGADFLLRPAYRPDQWRHDLVVLDGAAAPRPSSATHERWTVAGPLCFSGDVLARDVPLPDVEPGDLVLIRDTGAYAVGMWSRYCSRAIPAVVGFRDERAPVFEQLRARERAVDVVRFWS